MKEVNLEETSGMEQQTKGWMTTKLGNVLTLQRGFDLPSSERHSGTVPVVSSSGITGNHNVARVRAPGVITGRYGTLGEVFFLLEDFWPLNTTLYVKDFKGNDPRFVYYLLESLDFRPFSDKSSVPGLNRNHLHELSVAIPSALPEQHAIAHILGTLDDKIELNRQMNQTLDEIARTLFRSWFVDFGPVRAKAEGRQPEGMDAETAALFADRFVDSEFGQIPEGWEWSTVGQAFDLNPTRRLKQGVEAPFLEMKNVATTGHRPLAFGRKLTKGGARFQNGDTLFARITPCLENGKTSYVDFLGPDEIGFGSTEYIVMNTKPPLTSIWTYLVARHEPFREFAERAMTGTSGRQRVSAEAIARYPLVLPEDDVAQRFDDLVMPMFEMIRSNDEENVTLGSLRDTLLPELLSGRLVQQIR